MYPYRATSSSCVPCTDASPGAPAAAPHLLHHNPRAARAPGESTARCACRALTRAVPDMQPPARRRQGPLVRRCVLSSSSGLLLTGAVTPLIDVRLEDILDRQHLPPLGLKDFEEWLLFVEMSPENLCVPLRSARTGP
ncbi:hypothetical protein HYPSUDRAFT_40154 [Hypholoma sublateritium FD-334 SS-4]|uniref:Uncharacterized protein n=1 Tax=Hypholoma sublateritium (strain FD-334 SS-4) TaxID=945553 RepID=A0A0D2MI35_HYPSF|nr:hypothetical protein HYPSUDRAFT_40154 [Hypholoma sublateritium FD-334 SS-4]